MIFVGCRSQPQWEKDGPRLEAKVYCLDEICVEETLKQ